MSASYGINDEIPGSSRCAAFANVGAALRATLGRQAMTLDQFSVRTRKAR